VDAGLTFGAGERLGIFLLIAPHSMMPSTAMPGAADFKLKSEAPL
jgi:hypothetical protein